MSPSEIGFLGLMLILVVGTWYRSMEAREQANAVVGATCRDMGLQLLDGTVALRSLRPARDGQGRWALQRTYTFDYSADGFSRKQGFVIIRRGRIQSLGLAPDGSAP
jgi:hypothetical protein